MENYTRVLQPRQDSAVEENEVRIIAAGKPSNYIAYAHALLTEKGHSSIELKALGKAISKTVAIAEILKHRVAGLHQHTVLSSTEITDVWEPKEEGLDRIETVRRVSVIKITLSKSALDSGAMGYQAPLAAEEMEQLLPEEEAAIAGETGGDGGGENERSRRSGRSRGRGRGRRPPRAAAPADGAGGAGGAGPEANGGGNGRPDSRPRRTGRPRNRRGREHQEKGADGGREAAPAAATE